MPSPSLWERPPRVIAHRGATRALPRERRGLFSGRAVGGTEAPENTLAAFLRAVDVGARAWEFDVRLTADGVPVVMHDDDVSRTTEGTGRISEMTLAIVKELAIRGAKGEAVPTLAEVLPKAVASHTLLDVELKLDAGTPDSLARAVVHEVAVANAGSNVLYTSFDLAALAALADLAPDAPCGLLLLDAPDDETLALARLAGWRALVVPEYAATPPVVARVHAAGALLIAWTVNDPAAAMSLVANGVDCIVTDDPGALLRAGLEGDRT